MAAVLGIFGQVGDTLSGLSALSMAVGTLLSYLRKKDRVPRDEEASVGGDAAGALASLEERLKELEDRLGEGAASPSKRRERGTTGKRRKRRKISRRRMKAIWRTAVQRGPLLLAVAQHRGLVGDSLSRMARVRRG